jgi:hypothetical protein
MFVSRISRNIPYYGSNVADIDTHWLTFQNRPSLSEIFSDGTDRGIRSIRDKKVTTAFREYGYTQKEIGKYLGIDHSTVSLIVRTREKG